MLPDPTWLLVALNASPVAELVRGTAWLYPLLEIAHVLGLGLVFGGIFAVDIRLLGLRRTLPIDDLCAHILPWVWAGFVMNAVSGALLFTSDAVGFAASPPFQLKMALLVCAGLNAFWFHHRIAGHAAGTRGAEEPSTAARVSAVISIALWSGIIAAGRMIAYWE